MMRLAKISPHAIGIEQNQHWPGNKHGFLTLLLSQTKNTVFIQLRLHTDLQASFSMPMLDIFFENLSSFCDCSQSSTSVVIRRGSICSHELANSFCSIMNTFLALHVALTIGKRHFARYRNRHDPCSFCKYGYGL